VRESFVSVTANESHRVLPSDLNLGALFLDTNDLTGTVPACMDSLTHLRQLYVFNNELSGVLPEGLEELTSLRKCFSSLCLIACAYSISYTCYSFPIFIIFQ